MTTAVIALSDSTVMELTGRRIKRVNTELSASHMGQSLVVRLASSMFESMHLYLLGKLASRFRDDAIWFKGAAKDAWDGNVDVRASLPRITPKLEKIKTSLLEFRKDLLDMQQRKGTTEKTKHALGRTVAAAVDLFDSVEAFRWTLLELEANYSPISQGWVANTPEELDQLFARMALEE